MVILDRVYGSNVKGLTNKEEMGTYTKKAKAAGVTISVCRISLDRLRIDQSELHDIYRWWSIAYLNPATEK